MSEPKAAWSVRAVTFAQPHWPEVLQGVGVIGLAATPFLNDGSWAVGSVEMPKTAVLLLIFGGFVLVGGILSNRRVSRVRTLTEERDRALEKATTAADARKRLQDALAEALLVELQSLFREFGLGPDDRVSVYSYNQVDALFQLERFSSNPYLRTPGRDQYPLDEGFIADAWRQGAVFVSGMPDPDEDPEGYRNYQLEAGLDERVLNDLTMRPRSYLGMSLTDRTKTDTIGVIMFESMAPDGLQTLSERLGEDRLLSVGFLIMENRADEATDTTVAARKGY